MTTIGHSLYDLDITLIDQAPDLANLVTRLFNCNRFALDCESIGLGRNHPISLMNFALEDGSIYFVDLQEVRISNHLRSLLENPDIKKVMFDCRADTDCLWHQYGVDLNGIEDIQVMEYVNQHADLQPAHILPSYIDVVSKYYSQVIGDNLLGLKPNNMKKWAARPLKQSLVDYASLEISSFLNIGYHLLQEVLIYELNYHWSDVENWSKSYASFRVNNELFSRKDPYQSHHFMELGILTDLNSGDVPCTGCGLNLDHSEYSRNQLRKKTQKCIVCKQVKLELDKKKNMENNWGIGQNRANHWGKYGKKQDVEEALNTVYSIPTIYVL